MFIIAQFCIIIVHLLIGLSELFLNNGTAKGILVLCLSVIFLAFQQVSKYILKYFIIVEACFKKM